MSLWVKLTDLLLNVPPFVIILPYENAVHFRGGKYKRTLRDGFFWKIPIYDTVEKIDIKVQVVDLAEQTVTSKSGDSITVSGCIEYEVSNAKYAICNVLDYDESLQTKATIVLASTIARTDTENMTYDYIVAEVFDDLRIDALDWGLDVTSFGLNQFTKCPAIRIIT